MKKLLLLTLALSTCMLCGCEKKEAKPSDATSSSTTSSTTTTEAPETSTSTSTTSTTSTTSKTTKSCTAKKFSNKYSYVFKTKDECQKNTDKAFMDIIDHKDSEIFADKCIEIKDECNDTYYGIVFYYYDHNTDKEVERYY